MTAPFPGQCLRAERRRTDVGGGLLCDNACGSGTLTGDRSRVIADAVTAATPRTRYVSAVPG